MATDIHEQIKDPEKVLKVVRDFIDNYSIHELDVIHESARVIENAYDFIEALCDAAGYAETELDEEEDITMSDYDEDNPHIDNEGY